MSVSLAAARGALDRVVDPELDRSLTELEFIASLEVDGGDVTVALRLPTYWCSPSFAYLMVGDARDALQALPGALAFTHADGDPLSAEGLADYVRLARSVRISLQANTEFCTGLLAARYDDGLHDWQTKEVVA